MCGASGAGSLWHMAARLVRFNSARILASLFSPDQQCRKSARHSSLRETAYTRAGAANRSTIADTTAQVRNGRSALEPSRVGTTTVSRHGRPEEDEAPLARRPGLKIRRRIFGRRRQGRDGMNCCDWRSLLCARVDPDRWRWRQPAERRANESCLDNQTSCCEGLDLVRRRPVSSGSNGGRSQLVP
jgi:hypothetical protein